MVMDSVGRAGPEPAARGRKERPSTATVRQGYPLISSTLGTGARPSHRGHEQYQSAAVDRAGILVFRALKWLQPARQLILRVRPLLVFAPNGRYHGLMNGKPPR